MGRSGRDALRGKGPTQRQSNVTGQSVCLWKRRPGTHHFTRPHLDIARVKNVASHEVQNEIEHEAAVDENVNLLLS